MSVADTRKRKAPRRNLRKQASRHRGFAWRRWPIAGGLVLVLGWIAWAMAVRQFAPAGNTTLDRFDAIIVLGDRADKDGNPTPTLLARVTEAVHEYERGVAPRLIVTGAAVANQYVEAQVMAWTAEAQGVPASAVIIEPNARDTIQNACYAERIMKARGWDSAEVISSPSHLPRGGLIFSRLPIAWRTHAALPLEPRSAAYEAALGTLETLKTMRYLVWAQWRERCDP